MISQLSQASRFKLIWVFFFCFFPGVGYSMCNSYEQGIKDIRNYVHTIESHLPLGIFFYGKNCLIFLYPEYRHTFATSFCDKIICEYSFILVAK